MKNIVISGYYGFGNIGDEAILTSTIDSIRAMDSQVNITVLTSSAEYTGVHYNVNVISRNNLKGIVSAIKACDMFVSGGGSLFQDTTSSRSFMFYMLQIILALSLGKKVFVYAQGVGPLNRKINKIIFKHYINKVSYITVRDPQSYQDLESLGITKPPVEITADPVLNIELSNSGDELSLGKAKTHTVDGRKTIGICIREWAKAEDLHKTIAYICDGIAKKFNADIKFIPFYPTKDKAFSQLVIDSMEERADLIDTTGMEFEGIVRIFRDMDFILGMRLHSLIVAAICEMPFAGISYDPKIDGYLSQIGKKSLFDVNNSDKKSVDLDEVLLKIEKEMSSFDYLKNMSSLKELSQKNIECLFKVLNR